MKSGPVIFTLWTVVVTLVDFGNVIYTHEPNTSRYQSVYFHFLFEFLSNVHPIRICNTIPTTPLTRYASINRPNDRVIPSFRSGSTLYIFKSALPFG